MVDQDAPDPQFNAMTTRLLRREALRRAAEELNTTSAVGLEDALAFGRSHRRGRRVQNIRQCRAPCSSPPKVAGVSTNSHGA